MGITFPFENVTMYWFNYCAVKPSRPKQHDVVKQFVKFHYPITNNYESKCIVFRQTHCSETIKHQESCNLKCVCGKGGDWKVADCSN